MLFLRWTRALLLAGILTTSLLSTHSLAIVGGHDSSIKDWPSMVALVNQKLGYYPYQFCGGVLIARQWVLTSGSCVTEHTHNSIALNDLRLVMGRTDLAAHYGPDERRSVFRASAVFIHPEYGYELTNNDNDLALIKLDKPVQLYTNAIQLAVPATLAELSKATATGQQVIALGWGRSTEEQDFVNWNSDGSPPLATGGNNTLQQVSLPLVSTEQCKQWLRGLVVTDKMICAGREEGGVDTCIGDTGGPLYLVVNGKRKLVGITSFGLGCARPRSPGLYSNVPAAMEWIGSVIAKN